MRNIVLVRIDDRLIHGQVVTSWVKQTNANRIIIVDDTLTKDVFMKRLLKAAAPSGISVNIFTTEDAVQFLKQDPDAGENIIILAKVPEVIEALIDGGVVLNKVILGGMGAKKGRSRFNKNVSASSEEVECIRRILEKGVPMYYQMVPSEKAVDVKKII
ncbi:PTS system sorbose subfamily IIB component [Tepidanaerobacter acetatoxydans Re1]|uniref:PTS system sorbose subfamily IIB component n=1 Tax=Tepidanaerobacter acetatoxydans (strain DSM 21804 / JCM 16047 / Re1) TaxID=1209989 RepID=F4LTE6_TEPAE|nr:PTS sugar transporter subunit IIB [Tepidanaerobacter acetatoxydans]AEE90477.1 PTS system sorbose subfamily IIB component [Tepidanaerobacter acetatoxydans Re1]CCP24979.1 PTS system sorbose subfamily IIB component [Tepidanaerobacter acetatoxydans Re1]